MFGICNKNIALIAAGNQPLADFIQYTIVFFMPMLE